MVGRLVAVLLVVDGLVAHAGAEGAETRRYAPYADIPRGTAGTVALTLRIRNAGSTDLNCAASLAHWYSTRLGKVAPGKTLEIALRHAPRTGVLTLLNAHGDWMPIEAVRCGDSTAAGTLKGRVDLPHKAGPAPAVIERRCAPDIKDHIVCGPLDP